MKTEYKHLIFTKEKTPKGRKTEIWSCFNRFHQFLGRVKWYSAWRQYCWFQEQGFSQTVMAASCLDDISNFIGQLMEVRKK